jgi:hypothetical protein
MALNLQVANAISTTAQSVKDQNGNTSSLALSTGNVGIGTTNPAGPVHILGPALEPPAGLPAAQNGLLLGLQSTAGYKWIQSYGGALALNPRGNNVGIGTTSPGEHLTVGGGSLADTKLEVNAGGDQYAALRIKNSQGSWNWQVTPSADSPSGRLRLADETTGKEYLAITHDGNVGIGTVNPNTTLHVSSGHDLPQVRIDQTVDGHAAVLRFHSHFTPESQPVETFEWDIKAGQTGMYFDLNDDTKVSIDRLTGNVGIGTGTNTAREKLHVVGNVFVQGNISTGGTKPFVQAHPTDPSKEIVYVSLEGGEVGTYLRGTANLRNGKAEIRLPEHFSLVTDEDELTVQLTPRGKWLQLYVVELDTKQIVVQEAQGESGQFHYLIQGVRKGYENHEVIREKVGRPRERLRGRVSHSHSGSGSRVMASGGGKGSYLNI